MESFIKFGIGVVAVVALVLGLANYNRLSTIETLVEHLSTVVEPPVGGTPGPEFYQQVSFLAGQLSKTSIATTSQNASITISANEFIAWANSSVVSYSPGLNSVTLTLPASSTLKSLVATAGDSQRFCIRNATSTSATVVTFAGGLGTKLLVASSSVSAVGSVALPTGKVGCFNILREIATSTAYDINVLYTAFQ